VLIANITPVKNGFDRFPAHHLGDDIVQPLEILVEDGLFGQFLGGFADFAERNQAAIGTTNAQCFKIRHRGSLRPGEANLDLQRLAFAGHVNHACTLPSQGHLQGLRHIGDRHAMLGSLLTVQTKVDNRLRFIDEIVNIGNPLDAGDLLTHLFRHLGQFVGGGIQRSIDLGHKGGQDRWAGWTFDDFEVGTVRLADALDILAHAQGNFV